MISVLALEKKPCVNTNIIELASDMYDSMTRPSFKLDAANYVSECKYYDERYRKLTAPQINESDLFESN